MNEQAQLDALRPSPWQATYIFKPELKLMLESMVSYGVIYPIVVRREDMTIIDGFARWVCAQNPKVVAKWGKEVPVKYLDISEVDAMVLHVQLNRARGRVQAKPLSRLIKRIMRSGKFDEADLEVLFNMHPDELDLMLDGDLLKVKKVAEHKYSKAWVPVEAARPTAGVAQAISIERPPNADR